MSHEWSCLDTYREAVTLVIWVEWSYITNYNEMMTDTVIKLIYFVNRPIFIDKYISNLERIFNRIQREDVLVERSVVNGYWRWRDVPADWRRLQGIDVFLQFIITQITKSDFSSPVNIYQISSGIISNFFTTEAWFISPVICN